jgi:hypothetical protein
MWPSDLVGNDNVSCPSADFMNYENQVCQMALMLEEVLPLGQTPKAIQYLPTKSTCRHGWVHKY